MDAGVGPSNIPFSSCPAPHIHPFSSNRESETLPARGLLHILITLIY